MRLFDPGSVRYLALALLLSLTANLQAASGKLQHFKLVFNEYMLFDKYSCGSNLVIGNSWNLSDKCQDHSPSGDREDSGCELVRRG